MEHRNNFDLLRLFAACQVVYMHGVFHLGLPRGGSLFDLMSAFPGVACFFIISGFLVSKSYLDSTPLNYLAKRGLRIYPALIVNIAILELAMYLTGGFSHAVDWSLYPLRFLIFAATASDYIADAITGMRGVYGTTGFFRDYPSGVLWTLTIELSFYAALPIPLEIYKRSKLAGAVALSALTAASFSLSMHFSEAFQAQHKLLNITVPSYFWVFGIGVAARMAWSALKPLIEGRAIWWGALYVGVSFFSYLTIENPPGGPMWLEYKTQPSIIVALRTVLLALALLSCAYSFPRASRWLRGNDLSYAIYLYHMLIVSTLFAFGMTEHWYLWPALYASSAMIAWLSWRYVEAQALRVKGHQNFMSWNAKSVSSHHDPVGAIGLQRSPVAGTRGEERGSGGRGASRDHI